MMGIAIFALGYVVFCGVVIAASRVMAIRLVGTLDRREKGLDQ